MPCSPLTTDEHVAGRCSHGLPNAVRLADDVVAQRHAAALLARASGGVCRTSRSPRSTAGGASHGVVGATTTPPRAASCPRHAPHAEAESGRPAAARARVSGSSSASLSSDLTTKVARRRKRDSGTVHTSWHRVAHQAASTDAQATSRGTRQPTEGDRSMHRFPTVRRAGRDRGRVPRGRARRGRLSRRRASQHRAASRRSTPAGSCPAAWLTGRRRAVRLPPGTSAL